MITRTRTMALVAAAALSLAACSGGTDDADGTDAPTTEEGAAGTEFVGNESVQWASADVAATAVDGSLDATLTCEGAVPHNVVVEGVGGDAPLAECAGNDSTSFTLAVEPGTYTFYCAVPGHREAGMEGTLTVS